MLWFWVADFVEIDEEGNPKFFRNGIEIAYPYDLVDGFADPLEDEKSPPG